MIVVTGGAGLIGYNLVKQLNKQGREDILIVDNLNHEGKKKNLSELKYQLYLDKSIFLNYLPKLENIEIIYHQGACSSTTEKDEVYLQLNNVAYSKTLLHYCVEKKIPFIYASSASVYGNGEKGFEDASNDYKPINGYAQSKLDFDIYVTNYFENNIVSNKVIGLRYFNVYGVGEAHKQHMSSVVYKFYNAYKKGQSIKLFEGSDTILRDFVYVDDVVNVLLYCAEQQVTNGIYNVGTGRAASFELMGDTFKTYYKDAIIEHIPFPKELEGKYQYFTQANIEKLRSQGYQKEFLNLKQGIVKYLETIQDA